MSLTACPRCSAPNQFSSKFCNACGAHLNSGRLKGLLIALGVIAFIAILMTIFQNQKQTSLNSASRAIPSPTVDAMSTKQHLDRARLLIQNGHGAAALDDLSLIAPNTPDYAEAQKLMPRARALQQKEEKEEQAREEKLTISRRQSYANEMETRMLEQYQDFYVRTSGVNQTTLTIRYVLMSRPFVYNLINDGKFMGRLRELGFKKVVFTDGYDQTWRENV